MAFDEVGSRLLRILELADLSREPGLLAFEGLSVRFGRALPGTLGRLQRGGAGLEVFAASMPSEEPTVGVLGATEVLLVDSARDLQVLVTGSDGSVRPSSGAGPEVGEVLFEVGLLFSDVSELIGDVGRDHLDELLVRRTQLD
jgi:hypothetical protein